MEHDSFQHFPLGVPVPDSPHAVCVSLPTMADVIGYEEKDPDTLAQMKSGYPRFRLPNFVDQLARHYVETLDGSGRNVLLLVSEKAGKQLLAFINNEDAVLEGRDGIWIVHFPANEEAYRQGFKFLQHTGTGLSSRQAEDVLLKLGLIKSVYPETIEVDQPVAKVTEILRELTQVPERDILLCNSGMNAFYAAFQATSEIQRPKNKTIWIQLGWLYLDTSEILTKFLNGDEQHIKLLDVFDVEGLKQLLEENKGKVAAIVTEAPTNPMIQTPDLPKIYDLAKEHDVVLIADPTSSTPANIDLLPYADILANSLTKYAANQGDVLSGAIYYNAESPFYSQLTQLTPTHHEPPYVRDLQRLANEIKDYESTLKKIDRNAMALAEFLESHPNVSKVHWAYSPDSKANYSKLSKRTNAPGCLITIETIGPMQPVHDRLRLLKSPSFGTSWTMVCPFMYLAHYDLVTSEEGRSLLKKNNINGELLRISVGTEPTDALIEIFTEALALE